MFVLRFPMPLVVKVRDGLWPCRRTKRGGLRDRSKLPAFSEYWLHVPIRFPVVRELHPLRIPQQLSFHACGDRAEDHPFRVGTSGAEVRACGFAALARANPVALVSRRPREHA